MSPIDCRVFHSNTVQTLAGSIEIPQRKWHSPEIPHVYNQNYSFRVLHKDHVLVAILILIVHEHHGLPVCWSRLVDRPSRWSDNYPKYLEKCHLPCFGNYWCIGEAEWHNCILKMPISVAQSYLPLISRIKLGTMTVNLGKTSLAWRWPRISCIKDRRYWFWMVRHLSFYTYLLRLILLLEL